MRGLREIDRILRGEMTSASNLRETGLSLQLGHVILANLLLAAFSGACLGVYGIANRHEPEFRFLIADAVKVPLLFLLTLAVTFPSLYVFNALVGSQLGVAQLGRTHGRRFGGSPGSARIVRSHRGFLFHHEHQLSIHHSADRGHLYRGGRVRNQFSLAYHCENDRSIGSTGNSRGTRRRKYRGWSAIKHRRDRSDRECDSSHTRQGGDQGIRILDDCLRPGRDADALGAPAVHRHA